LSLVSNQVTIAPPFLIKSRMQTNMLTGILAAMGAGLVWGLVFIVPLLLPDYSGVEISLGRYVAFGLIAAVLAWFDRRRMARMSWADWKAAAQLSSIGNLVYYAALASAIRLADAPLPTVIIGTLPLTIAVCAKLTAPHGQLAWNRLIMPLALILAGIILVNISELRGFHGALSSYIGGALLACVALLAWTWYPIKNSRHLQDHPHITSASWSTAQGLTTLPLALAGFLILTGFRYAHSGVWLSPLGAQPARFCLIMLMTGLLGSWLGIQLWNFSSQRLPSTLGGLLIVFETLAALLYAFLFRGHMPDWRILAGAALLCSGVALAVILFKEQARSTAPTGLQ